MNAECRMQNAEVARFEAARADLARRRLLEAGALGREIVLRRNVLAALRKANGESAPIVPQKPESSDRLVINGHRLHRSVTRVYQGMNGHPMKSSEIAAASNSPIQTTVYALKGLMERRLVEKVPGRYPTHYIRTATAALLLAFCLLLSIFCCAAQPAFITRAEALRAYNLSTNPAAPAAAFAAPAVFVACNLKWDASPSPDVTGYRLDYYPTNNPANVHTLTFAKVTEATVMVEPTPQHFALYAISGNDVSGTAAHLIAAPVEKATVYSKKAPTPAGPWIRLAQVDAIADLKAKPMEFYSHDLVPTNSWVAIK